MYAYCVLIDQDSSSVLLLDMLLIDGGTVPSSGRVPTPVWGHSTQALSLLIQISRRRGLVARLVRADRCSSAYFSLIIDFHASMLTSRDIFRPSEALTCLASPFFFFFGFH
jgi:hypothetical protein